MNQPSVVTVEQVEEQLRAIALQREKVLNDVRMELVQLDAAEYALQVLLAPIRQAQMQTQNEESSEPLMNPENP